MEQEDGIMRPICGIVITGMIGLAWAESAQAGVYSTLESKWELSNEYFRLFQNNTLTPLKQLGSPEAKADWQKNYQLAAQGLLVARDPPWQVNMPIEQQLNLAVCLLRIREPGKAMPEKAFLFLKNARTKDPKNYLVMSTLGTTHQMLGENFKQAAVATLKTNPKAAEKIAAQMKAEYTNADTWLKAAYREYWSKPFKELSAEQRKYLEEDGILRSGEPKPPDRPYWAWKEADFDWYARCEKYHSHLVSLRFREMARTPLDYVQGLDRIDDLFDGVKFVGPSGKFEPGKIDPKELEKLPADAVKIVEQLLVWMPDDLRLYRLLGELVNAKGGVDDARIVFEEQVAKFSQTREAFGMTSDEVLAKFTEKYPDMGSRLQALRSYVPPPPPVETPQEGPKEAATSGAKPKTETPAPAGSFLNLDWQTLGVGMGAGIIIGFLLAWRLRDILRRRQLRQAVPARPSVAGPH
jgi:hypothetical protein